MIELRTLGSLSLSDSGGRDLRQLRAQPRRLALLAYLAIAAPHGTQQRDRVLLLFWPELDQPHARAALRQALHVLREALGEEVLVTSGDDAIGVDPARLWCDVAGFETALEEQRVGDALELYRGDLLEGFFVREAPDFERWVEEERVRLRLQAAQAATAFANACEARGDGEGAVRAARKASRLAPHDEPALRRLVQLLDRLGDRAGAIAAYEDFARRFREELEASPAPETEALVATVRTRNTPQPGTLAGTTGPGGTASTWRSSQPVLPPRRRWPLVAALGVAVVAGAALTVRIHEGAALDSRRVVVAPLVNRTGDSTLNSVGELAADWITRQLGETGMVELADAGPGLRGFGSTTGDRPRTPTLDPHAVALETGAGLVVGGSYYRHGDSLEFQVRITDERHRSVVRSFEPVMAPAIDPRPAVTTVSQRVTAGLATVLDQRIAEWAGAASQPPTLEAYQAFSAGVEAWFVGLDDRAALPYFYRAAALDSTFTLPLVWAAWAHRARRGCAWTDSIAQVLEARKMPLAHVDAALLDREVAICHGNAKAVYQASVRLLAAAPGSEMFAKDVAHFALVLGRPAEARDVLLRLHPDRGELRGHSPYYLFLTSAYHLLGQHDLELEAARRARAQIPNNMATARMELLALAALGRWEEIQRVFAELPALPPHPLRRPATTLRETGLELLAHGFADEGRQALQQAAAYSERLPPEQRATERSRADYLLTLMASERWSDASPIADSLVAQYPANPNYLGIKGFLAAVRGDRTAVEAALAALQRLRIPYPNGAVPYWRACIAARLRDPAAIPLLQQALTEGWGLPQAVPLEAAWDLHMDPLLAPLRGDPSFQALLRPRG